MFEYTKDYHFKFGYEGDGWYCNRTSPTQRFVCQYGRASEILSFREANLKAARYIGRIATDDISIMMSGGADSEITAWSFLDAGIPFRAAIMRFSRGYNSHDIQHAEQFCQRHNIKIDYYDLDVEQYLISDEFEATVKKYQTTCERATTLWMASRIPNFAILGQGEPVVVKIFGRWWFQEKERICSWNKFWIYNNRPGIPGFHQFSPEQILSCLIDDMTADLVNGNPSTWINDKIKHLFYKKHYPDFKIREKYTGFERLSNINLPIQQRILATFPYFIGEWKIPYEDAIKSFMPASRLSI